MPWPWLWLEAVPQVYSLAWEPPRAVGGALKRKKKKKKKKKKDRGPDLKTAGFEKG